MRAFNVMFLGDRRISQGAIRHLLSPKYAEHFHLKAMVTNNELYDLAKTESVFPDIDFISNAKRNTDLVVHAIVRNKIDLLLSVQHIWILPAKVLELVNWRALNLHNSALPEYKGFNSISHAIIDGAKEFRTTIHWMANDVDCGDIAFEGRIAIDEEETALSLYLKSVDAAVKEFKNLLDSLVDGTTPRKPMVGHGVFYQRGDLNKLKDISAVSDSGLVDRIMRASYFPPLDPAYQVVNGKKVFLLPQGACRELMVNISSANLPKKR